MLPSSAGRSSHSSRATSVRSRTNADEPIDIDVSAAERGEFRADVDVGAACPDPRPDGARS
jgi:hypothetical protein